MQTGAEHLHASDKRGVFKTSLLPTLTQQSEGNWSAGSPRDPTGVSATCVALALQNPQHVLAWGHDWSKGKEQSSRRENVSVVRSTGESPRGNVTPSTYNTDYSYRTAFNTSAHL